MSKNPTSLLLIASLTAASCLGAAVGPGALAAGAPPTLTESRATVQEKGRLEWVYTVGTDGLGAGDEIRLHDPHFHGMRWSKWGDASPFREKCTPQSTLQRASWGYVTATAWRDGAQLDDVGLGVERSNCTWREADEEWSCTADIHRETYTAVWLEGDGALQDQDQVVITYGDVAACEADCLEAGEEDCSYCANCGFEFADRAFREIPLLSEECLEGGSTCTDLDSVSLEVTAEPVVQTVFVEVPSLVLAGEDFTLKVSLLDRWGNAVASAGNTLTVSLDGASGEGGGETWTLSPTDEGWHDFTVSLDDPGVARLEVSAGEGLEGTSNPIQVLDEAPEHYLYWGDIHVHHGQSVVDEDGFLTDVNHAYARDVVGLDIVAESMKATGIEIDSGPLWEELQQGCAEQTVEGDYLVLLAFEWIGHIAADTYGTETEGHHNVYYDVCEAPLGTHSLDIIDSVSGDKGLWPWIREQQEEEGIDAVSVPHATRFTGHHFTADEPELQRLAEVYSEWGDSASLTDESEGSASEMLQAGIRVGWIGASDNHDGWMGNPFSEKDAASGLGAWWAPALTRADVFAAMKARRTFATTGHRPILRFFMEDTNGTQAAEVLPGSEVIARAPRFRWRVNGTAPVSDIILYSSAQEPGAEVVEEVLLTPDSLDPDAGLFTPEWDGETPTAYWLEVRQEDRERAWSSPIYISSDCARVDEGALDPLGLCDGGTGAGDEGGPSDDTGGGSTGSLPEDSGQPGPVSRDTGEDADDDNAFYCGCRGPQGNRAAAAGVLFLLALTGLRRRREPLS